MPKSAAHTIEPTEIAETIPQWINTPNHAIVVIGLPDKILGGKIMTHVVLKTASDVTKR